MSVSRDRGEAALIAVYATAERVTAAIPLVRARNARFRVFSPVNDTRLQEAVGLPRSPVRFLTLAGFVSGAAAGFGLCVFTALRWSFVVGGKPVLAWVPFTVIAFELSILLGVLATLGGMLFVGRIPRRHLPQAYDPRFSGDRFGLLVFPGAEPEEGGERLEAVLRSSGAEEVREIRV